MSTFQTLSAIDITPYLKKKGNINYLPWSSAWAIVKERFSDAKYGVLKTNDDMAYYTDGKTCWVETYVTINDETQTESLAVMNHRNQSIPADEVTSVDFERSIKRCLVKNLALFGLGLSLWNGEELSDTAKRVKAEKKAAADAAAIEKKKKDAALAAENAKIVELAKAKIAAGADQLSLYAIVEKYTGGKKNPNAIGSIEDSKACYAEINELYIG